MRKDSLIIFATSIVLTLGIVGVAHYLYLQDQKLIPDRPISKPRAVVGAVQSSPQTIQPTKRPNQPTKRRTNKIIKCTQPNGTVFWTNAKRCKNANLNNTLSYYDHVTPAPRAKVDNKRKTAQNTCSGYPLQVFCFRCLWSRLVGYVRQLTQVSPSISAMHLFRAL